MTNELVQLIDHINNITSGILLKYHTGIELTDLEEEVLRDIFKCEQERLMVSLEDIPHTNNNFINQIIMGRNAGSKNKSKINQINKNMGKLDLNTVVLNLNGKPVGDVGSELNPIMEIISKGGTIQQVQQYCQNRLTSEPLTIKKAAKFSVLNADLDKKSGEEKYNAYKLAMKIESENPELSVEELAAIKKAIGSTFMLPEVVGFIFDAIDSK
jgi:hypothetical protein